MSESVNQQVEQLEGALLAKPQVPLPVTHHFAPGCYARELFMPAGTLVIGLEHKTTHFNVMLTGKMRVLLDGQVKDLTAPQVCVSQAGTRKVAVILEDVRWITFHPSDETDPAKLEELLTVKSETYLHHLKTKEAQCLLQA